MGHWGVLEGFAVGRGFSGARGCSVCWCLCFVLPWDPLGARGAWCLRSVVASHTPGHWAGRSLFVRSCDLKVLATLTWRAIPEVLASITELASPAGLRLVLQPPDRLRRWNTRDH